MGLCLLVGWISALQAWTARAEAPLEVRGRVVTPEGQGLPAAVVDLEPLLPLKARAERQLAGARLPERTARFRSGPGGGFRITVPEPGFWRLSVRHPAYLPAGRDLSPLLDSEDVGTVSLESRSDLLVRVVGEDGRASAGTRVAARGWSERWRALSDQGWWPVDAYVETGADGVARVPCGRGERVSLAAFRDGRFAHQVVSCMDGAAVLELVHELAEAVVVDVGGAAVPSAAGFIRWPFLAFGISGADGRIRGPWRSESPVPVAFADDSGFFGDPRLGRTRDRGEELAVFQLGRTLAVTGQVVDAIGQEPVPGAWLWLGRGSHHFRTTDGKGQFVWRIPADRRGPLHAAAPGYLETVVSEVSGTDDWGTVLFRLAPALHQHGRVVDAAGQGIPDAEIRARIFPRPGARGTSLSLQGEGRWTLTERVTHSDDSGTFEVDRLAPWVSFELEVARAGYATRRIRLPALDPGEARDELEIVLELARTGFGRVVGVDETPIGGAEVELLPALVGSGSELDFAAGASRRTYTDGEGRFLLSDLACGTYYLAARGSGYPEVLVPGVEILPGTGAIDLGTVVLSAGVRLFGRVIDSGGRPLAGIDLQVRSADGEQIVVQRAASPWFASATSREDGSYEIAGLPADRRLTMLILGEDVLPDERAITTSTGDLELDLELDRGVRVAGRVEGAGGEPAVGATVELSRVAPGQPRDVSTGRSVRAGPGGRFEVTGLRAGVYEIVARREEGVAGPMRIEVSARGAEGVELRLRTRGVLEGRVVAPDGSPVARAFVWIDPLTSDGVLAAPRQRSRTYEVSDDSGRFRMAGVSEGSYRVSANHGGRAAASVDVAVSDGERTTVELRFEEALEAEREPAFEITGRVVDETGVPLEGVKVTLVGADVESEAFVLRHDRSSADGTFRLTAEAGEYRMVCQRSGFARYESRVFEIDSDLWDFAITMEPGATVVGTVAGLAFDELARAVVTARAEHDHLYGTINYQGEFRIPGLAPGQWIVQAQLLNPTRSARATVDVAPGDAEVRVDLRFEPGHQVTGQAFRDGVPFAGATVELRCPGDFRGETFTDDQGRFAIHDAPEGRCAAVLSDRDSGRKARREFDVTGDLEIVLEVLSADE